MWNPACKTTLRRGRTFSKFSNVYEHEDFQHVNRDELADYLRIQRKNQIMFLFFAGNVSLLSEIADNRWLVIIFAVCFEELKTFF